MIIRMAARNLYVKDSDQDVFQKLEEILEKQGKSISEFFADTARNFVELHENFADIELTGRHRKRVFKATRLYWAENNGFQQGVFRTAKGFYVYWEYTGDVEIFKRYDSLEELGDKASFDEDEWEEIENADAAIDGKVLVDHLDI